jgi:hypothetical protein
MGHRRVDDAHLHPLEHNLSQSTNDTYPTAIKIARQVQITRLHATLMDLASAFRAKAHEFSGVIKMGRTQVQDAVPMTLGQEFGTLVSEINLWAARRSTPVSTPTLATRIWSARSYLSWPNARWRQPVTLSRPLKMSVPSSRFPSRSRWPPKQASCNSTRLNRSSLTACSNR